MDVKLLAICLISVSALDLGGCSKSNPNPAKADAVMASADKIDTAALASVTRLVQADADQIPNSISQLLKAIVLQGQVTSEQLYVIEAGTSIPIDWWLWQHKLIEFRGLNDSGQALLGLSKKGIYASSKSSSWFQVSSVSEPSSSCDYSGGLSATKCTIVVGLAFRMSPIGLEIAGSIAPPSIVVSDTTTSDGKIWSADAVDYGSTGSVANLVAESMFGSDSDREAGRQRYLAWVATQTSSAPAVPEAQTPS